MHRKEKKFTKPGGKQCMEFGQALVLVFIGLDLYYKNSHFAAAAFWAMLATIFIPLIFFPFAAIWFGIGKILNYTSSWLILHIIFFILVVPTGMIRKWKGKDALKLKQFKKSRISVMTVRDHLYEASDLENTF